MRSHERAEGPVGDLRVPDGEMLPPELREPTRSGCVEVRQIEHAVVDATPYVRERLRTDQGSMYMIEQLVTYRGEPLYVRAGYYRTEVPRLSATVMELDRAEHIPDAREAFERIYGVPFGWQESIVEAVPCEARTSRLLGVPEGDPVLLREMLTHGADGMPWELSYTHYRGDLHVLVAGGDLG